MSELVQRELPAIPPVPDKNRNIHQRINAVMREVKYVQKDKQVDAGGAKYRAVTHDQLVSVARSAFVEHGVTIVPEQMSGGILIERDSSKDIKMHLYSGWYKVHFVNIDNPAQEVVVRVEAHAQDNGDKAPGKAMTYAVKTAVLKVLWLETGENDEARAEVGRPVSEFQAATIRKSLDSDPDRVEAFCAHYKIATLESLPHEQFDRAMVEINKANAAAKRAQRAQGN